MGARNASQYSKMKIEINDELKVMSRTIYTKKMILLFGCIRLIDYILLNFLCQTKEEDVLNNLMLDPP